MIYDRDNVTPYISLMRYEFPMSKWNIFAQRLPRNFIKLNYFITSFLASPCKDHNFSDIVDYFTFVLHVLILHIYPRLYEIATLKRMRLL